MGKQWKQWETLLFWLQNHCRWWLQPWNSKMLTLWKESYDQLSILKSRDITLPTKARLVKAMVFPVVMYGGESWMVKKSWVLKNWCFWTVVLEKTLESPLDCKEIQPVHPKGDQSWVFIGRTDAKAETPILWPPHVKSWLIGKDPNAGKDWRWEEKGTTEGEMVGWHYWLNGHESEWTPGVGDGQGGLACCNSWDPKESDTSERLNWTEYMWAENQQYLLQMIYSKRGAQVSLMTSLLTLLQISEVKPVRDAEALALQCKKWLVHKVRPTLEILWVWFQTES